MQETLLLKRFLQRYQQVKRINLNYFDLYFTVNKNLSVDEGEKFSSFFCPCKKTRKKELSGRNGIGKFNFHRASFAKCVRSTKDSANEKLIPTNFFIETNETE